MATPKKAHARYRIVGRQPVGRCKYCGGPGGYRWSGEEYCAIHCGEDVRVRTLMRRGVTALKQALGENYSVEITVTDKRTGKRS